VTKEAKSLIKNLREDYPLVKLLKATVLAKEEEEAIDYEDLKELVKETDW